VVDTIYLETTDFEVKDILKFKYVIGKYPYQESQNIVLGFSKKQGRRKIKAIDGIYAKHVFKIPTSHRAEIHFVVTSLGTTRKLTIKITSLPKLLYINNLFCLDNLKEYTAARKVIEKYMSELGITILNFDEFKITRVDLAFSMITREAVTDYVNELRSATLPRMLQIMHKDGVEFRAKGKSYAFYDKGKQLKSIQQKFKNDYFPFQERFKPNYSRTKVEIDKRILRIELQFKQRKIISDTLGIRTWSDLISNIQETRQIFRNIAIEVLDRAIISRSRRSKGQKKSKDSMQRSPRTALDLESMRRFLRNFKKKHGQKWFSQLVSVFGFLYIHDHFGENFFEILREILKEGATTDSYIDQFSRLKRMYREAIENDNEIGSTISFENGYSDHLAELYRDLNVYECVILGDNLDPKEPGGSSECFSFMGKGDLIAFLQENWPAKLGEPEIQTESLRTQLDSFMANTSQLIRQKIPYAEEPKACIEFQIEESRKYFEKYGEPQFKYEVPD
jgi:hypothetical protein